MLEIQCTQAGGQLDGRTRATFTSYVYNKYVHPAHFHTIREGPNERGVMVIKAKDKTRAAQRKGALKNWKKTGKTIIKYLRKRDISGDDLRREFWVHEEASR